MTTSSLGLISVENQPSLKAKNTDKSKAPQSLLIAVTIADDGRADEDLSQWYESVHLKMLSNVPSYRRSQLVRLRKSYLEVPNHMALHEFSDVNALEGKGGKILFSSKKLTEDARVVGISVYRLISSHIPA